MELINVQGLSYFEARQKKREDRLQALIATPFNCHNQEHLDKLERYLDVYEYNLNQMYLYQALSTGLKAGLSSWLAGKILPLPECIQYFLSTFFYIGAAAFVLKEFNMANFYSQTQEMKLLYNWCMKNNKMSYDPSLDNSKKLALPLIQRFIKLLAPLCETQFMIAWPTHPDANPTLSNQWAKTLRAGYTVAQATFSQLTQNTPSVELTYINALTCQVEKRQLDLTVYKGLEQAINYFSTSKEFQKIMMKTLNNPLETVDSVIPLSEIRSIFFK
ncbi:MAG: hypothetical protein CK426_04420 [Legionella sp.]|nr:MAG: hypothetical protein CK423_03670 [Legionella sp.]PJD98929.1 MAG: hypothetical protein CK426_04420 [Legionella sp.]